MGCRAQPVRYPISRTVQQMTRETRMGQPSYTEFRILPAILDPERLQQMTREARLGPPSYTEFRLLPTLVRSVPTAISKSFTA